MAPWRRSQASDPGSPRSIPDVDVTSLGLRTNLMIVTLAGGQVEDRGEYVVARSPDNPTFWWGNFLALPRPPQPEDVPG